MRGGGGRVRTFPIKLTEKVCREKKKRTVHKGTKIKFTFLKLDVHIANGVYKGLLIYIRLMFFPEYLKKHLGIKTN